MGCILLYRYVYLSNFFLDTLSYDDKAFEVLLYSNISDWQHLFPYQNIS